MGANRFSKMDRSFGGEGEVVFAGAGMRIGGRLRPCCRSPLAKLFRPSSCNDLPQNAQDFCPGVLLKLRDARMRQTGAAKNAFAIVVMLHLRAPYVSKTAILGCWVDRSGQKSKSRLNSKDLDRLVSH